MVRTYSKKEAKIYNANLTNHLFTRMVYNPDKPQYKADYENRFSEFVKGE